MNSLSFFVIGLLLVSLTACATKNDFSDIASFAAPDGAIHISEKIFRRCPPESAFDHAVFWYQIATIHQDQAANKKRSGIILKSCRIISTDQNGKTVFEKNFDGKSVLGPELGGLYNRNPKWFANDDHTPILDQKVFPDGLVINASLTPDKIIHWWSERFPYNRKHKYYLEMKIQIIGDVALQIGGDYWKGESSPHNGWNKECRGTNNCEAFVSEWYGDTKGKVITITRDL